MKKKYRVSWNEIYMCQSVVEAENEHEAIELAMGNEPDQKEYGESEDVNIEPFTDDEEYEKVMDKLDWASGRAFKGGI